MQGETSSDDRVRLGAHWRLAPVRTAVKPEAGHATRAGKPVRAIVIAVALSAAFWAGLAYLL